MKSISSVYGRRPYFKVIVGHIATSNGNQLYLDIAGYRILVCIYLTMHGTNLLKSMKNLGHRTILPKSSTGYKTFQSRILLTNLAGYVKLNIGFVEKQAKVTVSFVKRIFHGPNF